MSIVKNDAILTKNFLKDKKGFNSRVNYIIECLENQTVPNHWFSNANVKCNMLKTWVSKIEDVLK